MQTNSKIETDVFYDIGYGLYIATCYDGKKHNGFILNTVCQVTSNPELFAVTVNKQNYSFDIIKETGVMNINCLDTKTPFSVFKKFGFESGRNTDKFTDYEHFYSQNGLIYTKKYTNSFISLKNERYIDFDTHGMFVCSVTEAKKLANNENVTYAYYQKNIKPKSTLKSGGYVCKICGYVYKGDTLPEDFICPICKHGANDFEKIE